MSLFARENDHAQARHGSQWYMTISLSDVCVNCSGNPGNTQDGSCVLCHYPDPGNLITDQPRLMPSKPFYVEAVIDGSFVVCSKDGTLRATNNFWDSGEAIRLRNVCNAVFVIIVKTSEGFLLRGDFLLFAVVICLAVFVK